MEAGHHEPRVFTPLGDFGLAGDPSGRAPGFGLVEKRDEEPHGLAGLLMEVSGLIHHGLRQRLESGVGGLSQDERQAEVLAEVMDLRTGEMGVAPQNDLRLGKDPAQTGYQTLEDCDYLRTRRPGTGTQDRRDEPTATPFVDMQGLIAPGLEIAVEQGHLLRAVHRVFGIVDVQHDRPGRPGVGSDEGVYEGDGDPVQVASPDPVLEAAHRGLTGKVRPA